MYFSPLYFFMVLAFAIWPFDKADKNNPQEEIQLELPQNIHLFQNVRVSLMKSVDKALLEIQGPYQLFDGEGRPVLKGDGIMQTSITSSNKGIQIGNQSFSMTPITISSTTDGIKIGKYVYRDAIRLWPEDGNKLDVINEIDIENYLKGVLPWEANPSWDTETLKAQAIVSRTYALFRAVQRQDKAYDLSGDVTSQVYKGKTIENKITSAAIDATRGQILLFRGKIFPAFFHSTCGGVTASVESVTRTQVASGDEKPFFCDFCKGSKHYRWQSSFTKAEILDILRKKNHALLDLVRIKSRSSDASGRAYHLIFEGPNQSIKVLANNFRLWIGADKFKSTMIDRIQLKEGKFLFHGRGWGHGVGLCQYGAKHMGELGYNHEQILEFYYPGADIVDIDR